MSASKQQLLTAVVVSSIVLSAIAFAGTSAAVQTTVDGPAEVTKTDTFTLTSTVEFEEADRVDVRQYSLVLRSAGEGDGTVRINFAPDGTILGTEPKNGVVGNGQIRVTQLRNRMVVRPVAGNGSYGYGYGYGYGAGTLTFEIELDSKAFKQGDYETYLTVDTNDETDQFRSNVQSFTIQSPSEDAPGNSGGGPPGEERGQSTDDDRRDGDANGQAPRGRR